MRNVQFTESQNSNILKSIQAGRTLPNSIEEHSEIGKHSEWISSRYLRGGVRQHPEVGTELKQMQALESELQQLKQMYADLILEHRTLKSVIEKIV